MQIQQSSSSSVDRVQSRVEECVCVIHTFSLSLSLSPSSFPCLHFAQPMCMCETAQRSEHATNT